MEDSHGQATVMQHNRYERIVNFDFHWYHLVYECCLAHSIMIHGRLKEDLR